jgi:hypothetical protein
VQVKLIDRVRRGKLAMPRRTFIYGTQGIGKSTFAASAPGAIFIPTEDGLNDIDCASFPKAATFADVLAALDELHAEGHEFQTVVIDSLDWLERMIWDDVVADAAKTDNRIKNIESFGYGKGYLRALEPWRYMLGNLDRLRTDKGMGVVLVAHAAITKFENPEGESYDRYAPRLHKLASALCVEWADEVLFANYEATTRNVAEGFNQTRTVAIGDGKRVLRTQERPSALAKNRLNLPAELPLEWAAYASYFQQEVK